MDDGSSDGHGRRARRRAAQAADLPLEILRHGNNRGKGAAIRTGVLASSGDPVLVSDTDLSTPLTEWVKLAERLPTHPVAIGSRALGRGSRAQAAALLPPVHREDRSTGSSGLLAVRGIHDTQCGFKLFRGDVARDLFRGARIDRFAYDVEILYLARRRGLAIAEVPVLWFNSPESKVRVVRDALQTLWDVLRIRWMHRGAVAGGKRCPSRLRRSPAGTV